MANNYFQFKQFIVNQDKCAMKVGTDGVLLGAWAPVDGVANILDIGTGTGLISLMLAQRSSANITAIDIDEGAVCQAQENFRNSLWTGRLQALQADFTKYKPSCLFDLIVSNPPYFVDSLKSPDEQRSIARHDDLLSYNDLFEGVSTLLQKHGTFALIIPTDVAGIVISIAHRAGLYPCKRLDIITSPGKLPKRTMFCFIREQGEYETRELLIEIDRHRYSDDYISLTRDFYLKM